MKKSKINVAGHNKSPTSVCRHKPSNLVSIAILNLVGSLPLNQKSLKLTQAWSCSCFDTCDRYEGGNIGDQVSKTRIENKSIDGFAKLSVRQECGDNKGCPSHRESRRDSLCYDNSIDFIRCWHIVQYWTKMLLHDQYLQSRRRQEFDPEEFNVLAISLFWRLTLISYMYQWHSGVSYHTTARFNWAHHIVGGLLSLPKIDQGTNVVHVEKLARIVSHASLPSLQNLNRWVIGNRPALPQAWVEAEHSMMALHFARVMPSTCPNQNNDGGKYSAVSIELKMTTYNRFWPLNLSKHQNLDKIRMMGEALSLIAVV